MVRNVREGSPFEQMGNLGHPGHPPAPLPPSAAVITDYNGCPRFNRVTQRNKYATIRVEFKKSIRFKNSIQFLELVLHSPSVASH